MKDYNREYFRAPLRGYCLYEDDGFVHKAHICNISEGGMLLDQIAHFPSVSRVSVMFALPQFPEFKNYNTERLKSFSLEIFPRKIIRVMVDMVRRHGETSSVDDVLNSAMGIKFLDISPFNKQLIDQYVSRSCSNIVRLLYLIDNSTSFPEYIESARTLALILGYSSDAKIFELRNQVLHDYKSLQTV